MKIRLNGEERETAATTIAMLLRETNLLASQVAVELNGTVLFRHEFVETDVKEGDRVEIIRVVAGG
ncbi:MAG: sulfur carrier protein ThiS [Verrucomicrobia bacterium]|nr:sulfur carrier protein ThiS [Verrucomicrobiota bacterium]